ncbi:hypothetical protein BDA96_03G264500 [Sorghum bicolor]|uniref:Uncharacterized protein n=2 Tax=Sorghum bicolor TaxID=4558 RepID=A0A921RGC3_SORBI|nr:hypothetical protein BDA96_03G264500 [Sorghum bicolor]OQU87267.1 hypothetical protein SORBI_3003G244250 [Sorghum bicolor]
MQPRSAAQGEGSQKPATSVASARARAEGENLARGAERGTKSRGASRGRLVVFSYAAPSLFTPPHASLLLLITQLSSSSSSSSSSSGTSTPPHTTVSRPRSRRRNYYQPTGAQQSARGSGLKYSGR